MAKVTRSNPKAFETLAISLQALENHELKVGWFESAKYEDGTPVALAAASNERGNPARSIPARPMFRPTINTKEKSWQETAAQGAHAVIDGKATPEQVLGILGFQVQEDVKETINNVYSPPLSKLTILARKYKKVGGKLSGSVIGDLARLLASGKADLSGVSDKPLIDTHLMIDTLTHTVTKV